MKLKQRKECPEHGPMRIHETRWGHLHICEVDGCTVRCWGGDTSTPADEETRNLRKRCHAAFDRLWKYGKMRRAEAYRWLSRVMELPKKKAHIGMFDADQCRKLLDALESREATDD